MSEPQETPTDHPRRGGFGTFAWVLVLGLVVYVLSTGPVGKLAEHGVISEDYAEYVYAPLVWLDDNCPPAEAFFEWYLGTLWQVR